MFKKIMSLVLALIMVLGLVACGGGGTTSAPAGNTSTPSGTTSGATSKPADPAKPLKDTVNVALATAAESTDPHANTKENTMQTFQWVFESLVYADGEAVVHPALAESWEIKNDGKDYVFKVRQGVKFHSGNPMTIEDVVYSYQRALDMSFMKNYTGAIESVEKTGDWEITFHLKSANNGFIYQLFNLKVIEKAIAEKEGDTFGKAAHAGGTGPYKYVSYEPNTLVVFERFEDYWNIENVGNIKKINAHIVTNASTRVTALQTGELDFIPVPASNWDQIVKSGKFETLEQEGTNIINFIINFYREGSPLNDKRVRQAMKYAVDRQAVINVAAGGLGKVAEVLCNPTFIAGSTLDDELKSSFPYNPEKAKQLLADAGYPNGLTLEHPFLVPNKSDNEAIAQVLQNMWEAVGIKIKIEMAESSTASAQSKVGYHDVYLTSSLLVHHYSNLKRGIHTSTFKTQVAKYNSPELDSYLDNAEAALTDKERDEWYLKASKWMDDMAVNCPVYHPSKTYAWDPALDAPVGTYYLYIQEWNWT